jgi:anti-sigma regulatory factor (Ser/Thr protein kinase)
MPGRTAPRVGHVYLDVRQRRLYCLNDAARALQAEGLPFTPADLAQRPLHTPAGEPIKPSDLPLVVAWRTQAPVECRLLWPQPSGPAWQVAWVVSPVRDSDGQPVGLFGSVTCSPPEPDYRVVAELAHDLATPMQMLSLQSAMLNRFPQMDPNVQRIVDTICESADRAVQISRDLLKWCRAPTTWQSTVEATWFGLTPFLEALAREQDPAAQRKGLTLATDFAAAAGWSVHTDRVKLGRILSNFLTNAIRYTPAGRVEFTTAWRDEAGERVLAVGVVDTGPGISPEEQESIFQPFERGKAGKEGDSGGSGLGLAVADRLAEELGLALDIYSEHGRGSSFHVLLPTALLRQSE